jgi:hypothetical protein
LIYIVLLVIRPCLRRFNNKHRSFLSLGGRDFLPDESAKNRLMLNIKEYGHECTTYQRI